MSVIINSEEHILSNVDIIVSKSDANGDITYANPIFFKLSGYTKAQLTRKPHSIIRHPDMPKIVFKYLWDTIQKGEDVYAFVKNLSKDGGFYWVFAHIHIATNPDGSLRNYVSTRKVMSTKAREIIEPLYAKLLTAEKDGGMEASLALLLDFLEENNTNIEHFNQAMKNIQG